MEFVRPKRMSCEAHIAEVKDASGAASYFALGLERNNVKNNTEAV
jgi:hypothetical protein